MPSATKWHQWILSPCRHEEADTRILVGLHAPRDAMVMGSKFLIMKPNDTYVVVIAISVMPSLQLLGITTTNMSIRSPLVKDPVLAGFQCLK